MKKIVLYNATSDGCAKAILNGCYRFGRASLLRHGEWGGAMTTVIEYEEDKD